MTRDEVREAYGIDERGMIVAPGPYEGEMAYTPWFSERAGDGEELCWLEDDCGEFVSLVAIDDEDRAEWPEVGAALYAAVIEDDRGFVSVTLLLSEAEAQRWREAYDRGDEEDDSGEAAVRDTLENAVFAEFERRE